MRRDVLKGEQELRTFHFLVKVPAKKEWRGGPLLSNAAFLRCSSSTSCCSASAAAPPFLPACTDIGNKGFGSEQGMI